MYYLMKYSYEMEQFTNNICPKCDEELDPTPTGVMISCSDPDCDFRISESRMEEIISDINDGPTECQICGKPTNGFRLCWNCKQEENGDVLF